MSTSQKIILQIIKEEVIKFLKENYDEEDSGYIFDEKEQEIKGQLFGDFLYKNNSDFTKHVPWKVIPFPRLKKIWEDFMSTGVVRDVRGLDAIKDLMIENSIKVSIFTNLAGHTQWGDEESFDEYIGYWVSEQIKCLLPEKKEDRSQLEIPFNNPKKGYIRKPEQKLIAPCETTVHPFAQKIFNDFYDGFEDDYSKRYGLNNDKKDLENKDKGMTREEFSKILFEAMKDRFFDYYQDDSENKFGGFISDYGLRPLEILLSQLLRSNKPESDIPIIDKMLNVVHQRSDIAEWFVEGGSRSLNKLSGEISELYKRSDYM